MRGEDGRSSVRNLTVLFAFFGELFFGFDIYKQEYQERSQRKETNFFVDVFMKTK